MAYVDPTVVVSIPILMITIQLILVHHGIVHSPARRMLSVLSVLIVGQLMVVARSPLDIDGGVPG